MRNVKVDDANCERDCRYDDRTRPTIFDVTTTRKILVVGDAIDAMEPPDSVTSVAK